MEETSSSAPALVLLILTLLLLLAILLSAYAWLDGGNSNVLSSWIG